MKNRFLLLSGCLFLMMPEMTVRAEEAEMKNIRIISPLPEAALMITDDRDSEERTLMIREGEAEVKLQSGCTVLFTPQEMAAGWIASEVMEYRISDDTETIELPLHEFRLAHDLVGKEDSTGEEFRFELYDASDRKLGEWQNASGMWIQENLKLYPGAEYRLHTAEAPEGYLSGQDQIITVPDTLKEDTWHVVSEAVPYGERTIGTEPAEEGRILRFFSDPEDTEICRDAEGEEAEYECDEEGMFTAVLKEGTYYVSSPSVPDGYYPLEKEEFRFDLSAEELKICYTPVQLTVRMHAENDQALPEVTYLLYQGDTLLQQRQTDMAEFTICDEALKAGETYHLQVQLPYGFSCWETDREFTMPQQKQPEDPCLEFLISEDAMPPEDIVIPPSDPVPSDEKKTDDEEKTEETEEKDKKEAELPKPDYMMLSTGSLLPAAVQEKPAERQYSFLVVLQDTAGKRLSGAVLRVENEEGKTIAQWVSDEEAHRISGQIRAGETYIISQQTAAAGYEKLNMKIMFTMPDQTEEPLVTLTNRAVEERRIPDELTLPKTGMHISLGLAFLSLAVIAGLFAAKNKGGI